MRTAATAFFTAIGIGVVMAVTGLSFLDRLVRLLGATETIAPYARDYARYILLGAPVMTGSFVMNNLLRSQGYAVYAMAGITTGGILNMILDPVFIFGLRMGISGAAAATVISQCVSFCILFFQCTSAGMHPAEARKIYSVSQKFMERSFMQASRRCAARVWPARRQWP